VLSFVFDGLANKEIADQLQVSRVRSRNVAAAISEDRFPNAGQLVRIALEHYKDQLDHLEQPI